MICKEPGIRIITRKHLKELTNLEIKRNVFVLQVQNIYCKSHVLCFFLKKGKWHIWEKENKNLLQTACIKNLYGHECGQRQQVNGLLKMSDSPWVKQKEVSIKGILMFHVNPLRCLDKVLPVLP